MNEIRNERRSITRTWHLCSHIQFRQDESSHRKVNVCRARKHAANLFNHFLTEKLHKVCVTLQLTEARNWFVGWSVNYIVFTAVLRQNKRLRKGRYNEPSYSIRFLVFQTLVDFLRALPVASYRAA